MNVAEVALAPWVSAWRTRHTLRLALRRISSMLHAPCSRLLCSLLLVVQAMTGMFGAGRAVHLHGAHGLLLGGPRIHQGAGQSVRPTADEPGGPTHRGASTVDRSGCRGSTCCDAVRAHAKPETGEAAAGLHLHLIPRASRPARGAGGSPFEFEGPGTASDADFHAPGGCIAIDLPDDDRRVEQGGLPSRADGAGSDAALPAAWATALAAAERRCIGRLGCAPEPRPTWEHCALRTVRLRI